MALVRHRWKECAIQLNHHCHQCNESQSCAQRGMEMVRRGKGRDRDSGRGEGGNGESNEGGRQWADGGDQ